MKPLSGENRAISLFAAFLLLLCAGFSEASPETRVTDHDRRIVLDARVLPDPQGRLSVGDVVSGGRTFQAAATGINSICWYRVFLDPEIRQQGVWVLEAPRVHYSELYQVVNGKIQFIGMGGDLQPLSGKQLRTGISYFQIPLQPGRKITLLLRAENDAGISAAVAGKMALESSSYFSEHREKLLYSQGIYFGIMTVMGVYNLFLFFSIRDRSYLYYVLYILSFAFFWSIGSGSSLEMFWPESPLWNHLAGFYFTGLTNFFANKFGQTFLHTDRHVPVLHKLLVVLQWAVPVALTLSFIDASLPAEHLMAYTALAASVLMPVAAVRTYIKGFQPARFFLVAWAVLIVGIILYTLAFLGVVPVNSFTRQGMQIGSMIEVVLLSLALADRINSLKREKEKVQLRYSRDLEQQVSERTAELGIAKRNAEEALKFAEEANRAKSDFLANMSHELRTPLNAIIGYSEILEEELAENGSKAFISDILKIRSAGKHLLTLINHILDLSKVEAGKVELAIEDFDPRPAIHEALDTVQPLLLRNGNRLLTEGFDSVGFMRGDPLRVRQILFNLLSNACKFTHQGSITLSAAREVRADREYIRIDVQDTGIGMTPEQMSRLFRAFTQADISITRKYGGTGLGLAISRHYCRLMGGDILVESEFGKGTRFTAFLPAASPVESNPVSGPGLAVG